MPIQKVDTQKANIQKANTPSFDGQSAFYNSRTGFSQELCVSIANTLVSLTHDLIHRNIIEIGCGTGQIGYELGKLADSYLGLDMSLGMLGEFEKNYPDLRGAVKQTDAREMWPIVDHSNHIVFSSRALHWLDVEHVVSECYRVTAKENGYLFVGRIERPKDCWQRKLRSKLHQVLREQGYEPRDGQGHLRRLRDVLIQHSAIVLEPVIVQSWQSHDTLEKVIENWANKDGLAGTLPPPELKASILADLKKWGEESLINPSCALRSYTLHGFKLTH